MRPAVWRRLIFSLGLLTLMAGGAAALNDGGTLLVHFNPSLAYTSDYATWSGSSGIACPNDGVDGCPSYQGSCNYALDAVVTSPAPPGAGEIAFVLAAFPSGGCVRLGAVTFGIQYDDTRMVIFDQGTAASFELAQPDWPASGSGTALTFSGAPSTSPVTELYWFVVYAYGSTTLDLVGHPTQGANFADDAVPAHLSPVMGFGRGGLAGATGTHPNQPTPVEEVTWGAIKAEYWRNH